MAYAAEIYSENDGGYAAVLTVEEIDYVRTRRCAGGSGSAAGPQHRKGPGRTAAGAPEFKAGVSGAPAASPAAGARPTG
jgi:hypothetical protein